eukprot:174711_1
MVWKENCNTISLEIQEIIMEQEPKQTRIDMNDRAISGFRQSEWSQLEESKKIYFVFGYYRQEYITMNSNQFIPKDIVEIIINYCTCWQWKHNDHFLITNDSSRAKRISKSGSGSTIFSNDCIHNNKITKISITLRHLTGWIGLGIINYDHKPTGEWPYFYKYGYGYTSGPNPFEGKKFNDLFNTKGMKYGKQLNPSDVITMVVDLVDNQLSYEINGESQGIAFNIFPQKYKVFACMSTHECEFEFM